MPVTARILTVTMNPTLDVATRVERLLNHQKLRCETEAEQVGGGGINVAQVAHSLGTDCTAAFTSGGWRGKEIERRLVQDGITCLTLPIAQESRQCFTVYETSTQQEYRFILPGPTLSEQEWNQCLDLLTRAAMRSGWLIASGSLPPGAPADFYYQLFERVRPYPVQTVLDTSGPALARALDSDIRLIKPSREELEQLTGTPLESMDQCEHACKELLDRYSIQTVALSLGDQGALIVQDDVCLHVEPLQVTVTSTVGAGDSFVGGMVWALDQGHELAHAAQIATASAAAALQTQGKLRFDRDQILEVARTVKVTERR